MDSRCTQSHKRWVLVRVCSTTGGGQRGPTNQMPSWKSSNFGSDLSKSRWNATFKKGLSAFQPTDMNLIHQFIANEAANYPVVELCRMLGVSRSGYYGWADRPEPADDFAPRVEAAFWLHSRRYGSRRVTAEVQDELKTEGNGEWIGRRRVQRLMREMHLVAIQPRRFVPRTTDSRHGQQMSPNLLLEREIQVDRPRQVIVSDITYLPLQ